MLNIYTGDRGVWWYVIALLLMLLVICLVYLYWPAIVYIFNLHHSKTLPYLSKNFVGRTEEMKMVTGLVDFGNQGDIRIVNIFGSPGFGKSTLAVHVGHGMVRHGVVVHYVNMAEFSDKEVKIALAEKVLDSSDIVVYKQVTFQRLLRWARERYWNTLLILDNCDDVLNNQRKGFQDTIQKMIEESLNVKVLLTSRSVATFVKYYEWYKLEELSTAAACKLLDYKVPARIGLSCEEKEKIASLTGNVPLALQIIGALLHLPDSPSPSTIIGKLEEELILTLSSEDLPPHEQIYATITVSYKYLSAELQAVCHQLTIFPGSFNQEAASAIFDRYKSVAHDYYHHNIDELIRHLVRSSLLEHHQRDDRYQYHRLIKEYFLFVQRQQSSHEATELAPAFHVHYAQQLVMVSSKFQRDPEGSLAFLDIEHHNIEHLLGHIETMQPVKCKTPINIEEFLEAAIAVSSAIDVGLLGLRFSSTTLCDLVKHSVNQLDRMIHTLEYFLHQQRFTQKEILHHYLMLIRQLATCEEDINGILAAVQVYANRKHIIESKKFSIEFMEYINFYMKLSRYYDQLGLEGDVAECHRLIIQQTKADIAACEPNQCNYYDIGVAYHAINRYEEAANFFEMSIETTNNSKLKLNALIKLVDTYSMLADHNRLNSTIARLHTFSFDSDESDVNITLEAYVDELLHIMDLCRTASFIKETHQLEALLSGFVEETYKEQNKTKLALRILHHLYEAENYKQVIKLGTLLTSSFKTINPDDFIRTEKMNLSLLLGKAMFHEGNYFSGMNQMEIALQTILEHPGNYSSYQKSTACWYLIPRLIYIETCYHISRVGIETLVNTSLGLVYLLISPYPLTLVEPDNEESVHPTPEDHAYSHSIMTISGSVSALNPFMCLLKDQQQRLAQSAIDTVLNFYHTFLLYDQLEELRKIMHFCTCIFVVWAKLILSYLLYLYVRQPEILKFNLKRVLPKLFCHCYADIVFISTFLGRLVFVLVSTKSLLSVRTAIRLMRDPRHKLHDIIYRVY